MTAEVDFHFPFRNEDFQLLTPILQISCRLVPVGYNRGMIKRLAFFLFLLGVTGPLALTAAKAQEVRQENGPLAAKPKNSAVKDRLFEQLAGAQTAAEAKLIAEKIERHWHHSGSDTVDLLSRRAAFALTQNDYALAVELLDRMIGLKPDWSEAYFQRALVFILMEDQSRAVADIGRVLQLEPRQYVAMLTLAALLQKQDQKKKAFDLYNLVLRFYPLNETAQNATAHLRAEVQGRDL